MWIQFKCSATLEFRELNLSSTSVMSDEMMMVSKVMHVAYVSDSEDIPLVGRLPLVARRYKA